MMMMMMIKTMIVVEMDQTNFTLLPGHLPSDFWSCMRQPFVEKRLNSHPQQVVPQKQDFLQALEHKLHWKIDE